MTIDVRVEKAASAAAAGFQYVRSRDLAVVSIIGRRDSSCIPLAVTLKACIVKLEAFLSVWLRTLPLHRIILFAATMCSHEHNALMRRRGIWGSEGLGWLPPDAQRSNSVEIQGGEGERFAGLVLVGTGGLFEAAEYARTHRSAFLLLSSDVTLTEDRVRLLAQQAFPTGGSDPSWATILEQIVGREEVFIRASGGFDDPEAAIDAFLSGNLLDRLEAP